MSPYSVWYEQFVKSVEQMGIKADSPEALDLLRDAEGNPAILQEEPAVQNLQENQPENNNNQPNPQEKQPKKPDLKTLTEVQKQKLYELSLAGKLFMYQVDAVGPLAIHIIASRPEKVNAPQNPENVNPQEQNHLPVITDLENKSKALTDEEFTKLNELDGVKQSILNAQAKMETDRRDVTLWFSSLLTTLKDNGYDTDSPEAARLLFSADNNLALQPDEAAKYDPLTGPLKSMPESQQRRLYALAKQNDLVLLTKSGLAKDGYHLISVPKYQEQIPAEGEQQPEPKFDPADKPLFSRNVKDVTEADLGNLTPENQEIFKNTAKKYNAAAKPSEAEVWYDSFLKRMTEFGYDIDNPAAALFLHEGEKNELAFAKNEVGMDLIANMQSGKCVLSRATAEQKQRLYDLAKESKLVLYPQEDYIAGPDGGGHDVPAIPEDAIIFTASAGENAQTGLFPFPTETNPGDQSIKGIAAGAASKEENQLTPQEKTAKAVMARITEGASRILEDKETSVHLVAALAKDMKAFPDFYDSSLPPEKIDERIDYIQQLEECRVKGTVLPEEYQEEFGRRAALDTVSKTITDIFPGGKTLKELVDDGLILDHDANPIEYDPEKPWDVYQKVYDEFNSEEGACIRDLSEKADAFQRVKLDQQIYRVQKDKKNRPLINGKLKKQILADLAEVCDGLKKMPTKDADFKQLQKDCDATIKYLKKQSDSRAFMEKLNTFTEAADKYFLTHAGLNLRPKHAKKVQAAIQLRNLRDAAKDGLLEEKPYTGTKDKETNPLDVQRRRLAERYVRSMCAMNITYGKDQETVQKYTEITRDLNKFEAKVNDVLTKDAPFIYQFGGEGKEVEKRINDAMNQSPAAMYFSMANTLAAFKDPETRTQARTKVEHDRIMSQKKGFNRMSTYKKGPVEPDTDQQIKDLLVQLGGELSAQDGRGSAEYQAFAKEMRIAAIRAGSYSSTMDLRQQMAMLADKADRYVGKKAGVDLNERGSKRFQIANKIRRLADALDENKKLNEVEELYDPVAAAKKDLAERIATGTVDLMLKSQDPTTQERGKNIQLNASAFRQQMDKIMKSDGFQSLYGNDPKALNKALQKDPTALVSEISAAERKLHPENAKKIEEINVVKTAPKKQEPTGPNQENAGEPKKEENKQEKVL